MDERSSPPVAPPARLRPFLDPEGRLKAWPAKHSLGLQALAWLAQRFEPGRAYTEKEVNALLNEAHTFGDWAILRRGLVDHRHLERERDGSRYWRRAPDPVEG